MLASAEKHLHVALSQAEEFLRLTEKAYGQGREVQAHIKGSRGRGRTETSTRRRTGQTAASGGRERSTGQEPGRSEHRRFSSGRRSPTLRHSAAVSAKRPRTDATGARTSGGALPRERPSTNAAATRAISGKRTTVWHRLRHRRKSVAHCATIPGVGLPVGPDPSIEPEISVDASRPDSERSDRGANPGSIS